MYPSQQTSIGLPEPLEKAGAYVFLFISGILLLIFEKNPNVRHHARQSIFASILIFLPLALLSFFSGILGGVFGIIPLIGGIFHLFFGALAMIASVLSLIIWLGLMFTAAFTDRHFTIPGAHRLERSMR